MKYELSDIELQDIEDFLWEIQQSFNIKFRENELIDLKTFGELYDSIVTKIDLENNDECTSQQAFYKLRTAITTELKFDKALVNPNTSIDSILAGGNKRRKIRMIENHIGFKLHILRPPHWLTNSLIVFFIVSLVVILIDWKIGLGGIILSGYSLWFSYKTATIIDPKTLGEVAEKMTRENYIKSRRFPSTFNKSEINAILIDLFCEKFDLDKRSLNNDSKFGTV